MELRGPRVRLRLLVEADFGELSRLLQQPGAAPWWTDPSEMGLRAATIGAPGTVSWSVDVDGHLAGLVSAFDAGWPPGAYVGLAVALGDSWQEHGLGPEALSLVIAHIASERGVHRFTIDPAAENTRAIRAYEKLGFRRVGIMRQSEVAPDGSWRDCMLMDLLIGEFVDQATDR
ncbi:MAG: GNAT family N-acetyltransferase [Coriobacteriia bacterium]|nr:GNAT family N-acetyltransferase [Propionibacteriaceae bacterium]